MWHAEHMDTLKIVIPLCSSTFACYRLAFTPTEEELIDVEQRFAVEGCGKRLVIPENFSRTLSPYSEGTSVDHNAGKNLEHFTTKYTGK